MKGLVTLGILLPLLLAAPDIDQIREDYRKAPESEAMTQRLNDVLSSVSKNDDKVLVAYRGAVLTLMSKFAQGIRNKRTFFKEGAELLEFAVASEPNNVEIRCIRLSVQENAPKITRYKDNIEEDHAFILKNFQSVEDAGAKAFIKGYVQQSEVFDEAQKKLF